MEVLGEIEAVVDLIRNKFPGVKIILSELTPRKDERDREVQLCNEELGNYANQQDDVFLIIHQNLRDNTLSMLYDNKHIRETKIPIFAANIIRTLKKAYNISDKRALYLNDRPTRNEDVRNIFTHDKANNYHRNVKYDNYMTYETNHENMQMESKMKNLANYNNAEEFKQMKHDLLKKLQEVLLGP